MKLTSVARYIISVTRGVGVASRTYIVGLAKTKSHAEKVIKEIGMKEVQGIDEEKMLVWFEHADDGSYCRVKTQNRTISDPSSGIWTGNDVASINEYDLYCEVRYEIIYKFESPVEYV